MAPKRRFIDLSQDVTTREEVDAYKRQVEAEKAARSAAARERQRKRGPPPSIPGSGSGSSRAAPRLGLPDAPDKADQGEAGGSGSLTAYAVHKQRRRAEFEERRPQAVADLRAYAATVLPLEAADARSDKQSLLLQRFERVAVAAHGCNRLGPPARAAAAADGRDVAYFCHEGAFLVKLPVLRCTGCGADREARPTELGCCAPTAAWPQQMMDCGLLRQFAAAGGGAAQFRAGLQAAWGLGREGEGRSGPPLEARALRAAAQEWQRLQAALQPAELDPASSAPAPTPAPLAPPNDGDTAGANAPRTGESPAAALA
ncbi:hypothetical protein Rsub_11467 [Raphidocelis subcapitata]|uniref:Uncharacterized protein n=1 Tax=Raphidocelis subcapitata TaxID=307507 RepID=A0A2V0PLE9_9CHLO|nr:hypothetical protein Rsub_11467 [Raphidocelis subcapitata]|eukprot:GBF98863.1 hypothetical protein Rsub_11467 [Raphidocelis subcapitata]